MRLLSRLLRVLMCLRPFFDLKNYRYDTSYRIQSYDECINKHVRYNYVLVLFYFPFFCEQLFTLFLDNNNQKFHGAIFQIENLTRIIGHFTMSLIAHFSQVVIW